MEVKKMRKRKNRWNAVFALSLAVLVAGLGFSGWTVYKHNGRAPEGIAAAREPTEIVDVTIPAVSAAGWQPAARLADLRTAIADTWDKKEIESLVDQGFRSVILPLAFEEFSPEEALRAKKVLDSLGKLDVFRTLTVRPTAEKDLSAFALAFSKLIEHSSFDAILVKDTAKDADMLTKFMDVLGDVLKKAKLDALPIAFELPADVTGQLSEHLETIKQLAGTVAKPEFLVSAAKESVGQLEKIGELLGVGDKAGPLLTAAVDLKDAIPNGTLEEVVQFLESLGSLKDVSLAISDSDSILKNGKAAELLKQFFNCDLDVSTLKRGFTLNTPVSKVKAEQTVHTELPSVNFSGGSNPLYPLLCDGEEVERNESGDFTLDFTLKPGNNPFKFEHQGKIYVVNMVYVPVIMQDFDPKSPVETTGGIELAVSVSARKNATVRASLDGQNIDLKPGAAAEEDGANAAPVESDFITYTGSFALPNAAQGKSLGSITYNASYQGASEWKTGVTVKLLPDIILPPDPPEPVTDPTGPATSPAGDPGTDTTEPPTEPPTEAIPAGELLTPSKNHGLGKAQMVRVKAAYANAHWTGGTGAQSNPTSSPLLEGTYDYVSGVTKIGSYTYYALASGKRTDGSNLELVSSGYKLPLNELVAQSSVGNGALVLRFGVKWKAPFNVDLIGQNYTAALGFNGYTHGVSSFNATGLAITFYHTKNYSGSVNVGSSALFSDAQWSRDTAKDTVTLKLAFRNPGKFYGYKAYYEGNQLVLRLRQKPPAGLNGAVIFLDPGHGGSDPGARMVATHATFTQEKFVNIALAMKLKEKLEAQGATVYITRTGDTYYSLQQRTDKTRQVNPDLFISIHCDSTASSTPTGTSAFYYKAYSQPLAKAVHTRIANAWKEQIYTEANYPGDYATLRSKASRGTYFYPFEVTRIEECPAILVEYGFGSNLTESRALQKEQNQDILVQATVQGIEDYFTAAQ